MRIKSLLKGLFFFSLCCSLLGSCGGSSSGESVSVTTVNSTSTSTVSAGGASVTLAGSVYDSPIPSATVTVKKVFENGTSVVVGTTTADSSGNWTLDVPESEISANATFLVEVSGSLNGKDVSFRSILGKGKSIMEVANSTGGNVTSEKMPDLIVSNISTVDYILSLLQTGGNLTTLASDAEELISAIKSAKLEVRGEIAAAIKAYLDEGAVLNATFVGGDNFTSLLRALVSSSADGSLNSTEIGNIFLPGEDLKVYKAQYDILNDPVLKKVYTQTYKTTTTNATVLADSLEGQVLYWKDFPDYYRKLTFNNGTISVSFVIYNGTGWEELSPENASLMGFEFDPANWISGYELSGNTLYLTSKAGEKFEVNLLDNSTSAYSILLVNRGGSIRWGTLLETANETGIPIVGVYGNTTYQNVAAFRQAFSSCNSSNPSTCFMGQFELNGTVNAVAGNVTLPAAFPGVPSLVLGEWRIDTLNDTLRVVLFDPGFSKGNDGFISDMVIGVYNSTRDGNYTGTSLFDFSNFAGAANVTLRDGLPLVYFSFDVLKLPLFKSEAAVQSYVPPLFAAADSLEDNSTVGSQALPLDARQMLCGIGSTDAPAATISCDSSYSNITITTGGVDYYINATGALIDNSSGSYAGYLFEITPFSFSANIGGGNQTFVNSTKKDEILGDVVKFE
ncbi:hypothetical protein [Desulfurobacterium sp.]